MDSKETVNRAHKRFKWLAFGYIVATGISALATILLARLMAPANYGLYAKALLLPSIWGGITTLGIESGTTFFIASYFMKNKDMAQKYFKTALVFIALYALSFSLLLFIFSPLIASVIFKDPHLAIYFKISSFILISMAINAVVNGGLISMNKQKIVAIYIILTSILRNLLAITLYVQHRVPYYAVLGQTTGYLSMAILYWLYAYKVSRPGSLSMSVFKEMFSYSIPYGIGTFIVIICTQFYNVVAAVIFDKFMYGNFSAAWLLLSGTMTIPGSLSASFFPSFSEAELKSTNITPIFDSAVKFASSILIYIWITIGGLSDFFVNLIFGPDYTLASGMFAMLSSVFILSAIGWGIINPLLLSLRKTKELAIINIASVGISILILGILINFGSLGYIWAIPIAFFSLYVFATLFGIGFLVRKYKIKLPIGAAIKLISIALILFYAVKKLGNGMLNILMRYIGIHVTDFMVLVLMLIVGAVYIFLIIALGIISKEEYLMLKNAFLKWIIGKMADKIVEPAMKVNKKLLDYNIHGKIATPIKKIIGNKNNKVSKENQ